jgi:hypothetical protein
LIFMLKALGMKLQRKYFRTCGVLRTNQTCQVA